MPPATGGLSRLRGSLSLPPHSLGPQAASPLPPLLDQFSNAVNRCGQSDLLLAPRRDRPYCPPDSTCWRWQPSSYPRTRVSTKKLLRLSEL